MCGSAPDYSQVNDEDVHGIEGDRFNELTDVVTNGASKPNPVTVEDFSGLSFGTGYAQMVGASDDVAPNHTGMWRELSGKIQGAAATFQTALNATRGDDGWKGATGAAALKNIESSLGTPAQIATAASRMSIIVDGFSRGIHDTKKSFVENIDKYNQDLENYPEQAQQVVDDYDSYARTVMSTIYTPVIDTVAANHPDAGSITAPTLGGTPSVPTGPASAPGGPSGGAPAGPPSAPGLPDSLFTGGTPTGLGAPGKGAGDPSKGMTDAAKGIGDAAKGAGDAAKGAGGQLGNAAQQALGSLGQALKGGAKPPGGLPEGVLNLGPKAATVAGKLGGAGGGRGGGGVGGTSPKAASPNTATVPTKAAAAAPVSRAGISGQGAAGGAGAPAAGNRGGAAAGTVHKANKALRNQRNGQDVIGEADAAVPVVGDEAPKPTAKPGAS